MANFDLDTTSLRDFNRYLHNSPESRISVVNPSGRHNIAVGVDAEVAVDIDGHVGYYCAGMNKSANITVRGNAGPAVAENMMSGVVRVAGNASQYAGASGRGGMLIVEGDASSRCGISMKGIDIVISGNVGHMCGFMAQKGNLVICGNADNHLGDSLYEAVVYVRGDVGELGTDCIEKQMSPAHRKNLSALLSSAGLTHSVDEFRRFGSARKLYHFDIGHADSY